MEKNIILFTPSITGGGAEKVTRDLANLFAKNEFNVTLICVYEKKINQYDLLSEVNTIYLNSRKIIFSIFKISLLLLKVKRSILISSITPLNCLVSFIKLFVKKHKLILMQHEIPSFEFGRGKKFKRIIPFIMRLLYKNADSVICVSKGLKNEIVELLGKKSKRKIKVIYNLNSFERNQLGKKNYLSKSNLASKNIIKILSIGRLHIAKNFMSLIKAFYLLKKEINAKLTIVGSGPEEIKLKRYINKLNMNEFINLIPFSNDIQKHYEEADIYVSSSIYESFGNTIVEAMNFGLHIIVTDCPYGPQEICENGKYGYIAKTNSSYDLYEKLNICIATNLLPDYKKHLERFSEAKILREFLNLPSFSDLE